MNPFFDISSDENLPDTELPLRNLGNRRIYAIVGGRRGSTYWGTKASPSTTHYTDIVPDDYDNLFVYKLQKWKPVYEIDRLIEHHYRHYVNSHLEDDTFFKHMSYEILPKLKKQKNAESLIELFEQWLDQKKPSIKKQSMPNTVHNTINVGNINAPAQFQQNSKHTVQIQHNGYQKEDIKNAFELLEKYIRNFDEQIRKDFAMEMDYAITQLERDKDVKPQLLNIGSLMAQIGIGSFSSLLAAPVFELIKPYLGLH